MNTSHRTNNEESDTENLISQWVILLNDQKYDELLIKIEVDVQDCNGYYHSEETFKKYYFKINSILEYIHDSDIRYLFIQNLFDYIVVNRFHILHPSSDEMSDFEKKVKKNLIKFYHEYDWKPAQKYYWRIYDENVALVTSYPDEEDVDVSYAVSS